MQFHRLLPATIALVTALGATTVRAQTDVPTPEPKVIARLTREYETALKDDPHAELIRKLEQALRFPDNAPQGTYSAMLDDLKKNRPPASTPLLLRALLQHAHECWVRHHVLNTLEEVAGCRIERPQMVHPAELLEVGMRLYREWYPSDAAPQDGKQHEEKIRAILHRIGTQRYMSGDNGTAAYAASAVERSLAGSADGWSPSELSPDMVDALLEVVDDATHLDHVVPMLCSLGVAKDLEPRLADEALGPNQRYAILVALVHGRQPLRVREAAAVLESPGLSYPTRIRLISLLRRARREDRDEAAAALVRSMEDPMPEMRVAAAQTLNSMGGSAAVTFALRVLSGAGSGDTLQLATEILAHSGDPRAVPELARFLATARSTPMALPALGAFEQATGRHWLQSESRLEAAVTAALAWWQAVAGSPPPDATQVEEDPSECNNLPNPLALANYYTRGRNPWDFNPEQNPTPLLLHEWYAEARSRIEKAMTEAGLHLVRDYRYDRDGVTFTATGFDPDRGIGFVLEGPVPSESAGNPADLSPEEAERLDRRALRNREFVAFVSLWSNVLYVPGRGGPDTSPNALAGLDPQVTAFLAWARGMAARQYPSDSPEPRNLFPAEGWTCGPRPIEFEGECGTGKPVYIQGWIVCEWIEEEFAKAGIQLTPGYRLSREGVSCTLTGYDPARRIGFTLGAGYSDDPDEKNLTTGEAARLAQAAERGEEFIAMIRWDDSFTRLYSGRSAGKWYMEKWDEIQSIPDGKRREAAQKALERESYLMDGRDQRARIQRRVREFIAWAQKRGAK